MTLPFFKYQGTGNDFIVIDDRDKAFPSSDVEGVARLCDRRFGIGSDGILLLQEDDFLDFYVDFLNPDGSRSFCGNGSRCAVSFARRLGMMEEEKCSFRAIDGVHLAHIDENGLVHLGMNEVDLVEYIGADLLLDTGSPHYVRIVEDVEKVDVVKEGKAIRYAGPFKENGVNVNFVQRIDSGTIAMRTYERGVEDETLSCGTGVTASVLALRTAGLLEGDTADVRTKGGILQLSSTYDGEMAFTDIHLVGPAEMTFSGEVDI